jgi:cold shock CspA family protein
VTKGFGFISPDGGEPPLWVLSTQLAASGRFGKICTLRCFRFFL